MSLIVHNRHPEYKTSNKIKNIAEFVEAFEISLQDLSKNGKQIDLKPEQVAAIKSLVHGHAGCPRNFANWFLAKALSIKYSWELRRRCQKIVPVFW